MLFALICTDKPGALQVRLDNRPAHIEFLKGLGDQLKGAGPFLSEAGEMNGSLVLIEASDKSAVEALAAADPYAKAGLFESVDIRPWNWAVKNPETI
ncbi:YciI family protein [Roseibium sp. CAU 1637]|uniref:YciI family protein n=1 Tax=Roseibium limicola TaxID=2816037 RepID=A0A939JA51_9HYPH|nr:YciI-like protein [Roseibium limicola]MBO0346584.1 YciI family protein [Roseibium limicola]